jgi:hypothetical protein
MRKTPPAARAEAQTRFRSIVTTVLLMALSLLVVRDILVRRWGPAARPGRDTPSALS